MILVLCIAILVVGCQSASVIKRDHDPGTAEFCLECRINDHETLEECLAKDPIEYEECQPARPECMTQLWNWGGRPELVFVSECQELEACIQESQNEPKSNNCDDPPIHVQTKCRYCCDATTMNHTYHFCPPPPMPTDPWEICSCWGDPHCNAFDGGRFTIGGDCYYTLVDLDMGGNPSIGLIVEVDFIEDNGRYRVQNLRLTSRRGGGSKVLIVGPNDGINQPSFSLDGGSITPTEPNDSVGGNRFDLFMNNDHTLTISMGDDLEVLWHPNKYVQVLMKQPFAGLTSVGICTELGLTGDEQAVADSYGNDCP